MDTPGPYETRATEAFYYVTPVEPDWDDKHKEEHLRLYNPSVVAMINVHEAYPGHYLQFLYAPRFPTKTRKLTLSQHQRRRVGALHRADGGRPGVRRRRSEDPPGAALRRRLLRDCRYVVGIKLHTAGWTVEEGAKLFDEQGFQEPANAYEEARRGAYNPTYLYYTLGKLEIQDLARRVHGEEARHPEAVPRRLRLARGAAHSAGAPDLAPLTPGAAAYTARPPCRLCPPSAGSGATSAATSGSRSCPPPVIVALAFAVTMIFVKPAPPKRLTIAIAADEGGSRYYAKQVPGDPQAPRGHAGGAADQRLAGQPQALGRHELSAWTWPSSRAASNGSEKAPNMVSLGSVAYVPLWVFYRGEPTEDVRDLGGRRIAVGGLESGTRALAIKLLQAAGVDKPPTTLLAVERDDAAEQLKRGEIDAAFLVSPAEAPLIKKLAAAPGIRMLSFARADAYVRIFPSLSRLTLPRGVFDLAADLPERDEVLVSATANLLAKDSLHPALAYLLLRAASEVHSSAGLLDAPGEFPAPRESGFPISQEARRYYQAGVPFLQRYLPFWAANLVDRLWVMLVPIIAVMVPLGRIVPAVYRWRIRSRVFRWYANLKQIELQLEDGSDQDLHDMLRRLDETERAVNAIRTPLAYAENLYFFREHMEVVRRRILRRLGEEQVPRET